MREKVYKKWITQKGEPYEVKLLDFEDFVRNNNYVAKHEHEGNTYIGEVWSCVNLQTKKREQCIIRQPYVSEDVGWSYNKPTDQEIDKWVNPLVDEYEDWFLYCNSAPTTVIARHPNRQLIAEQEKDNIKVIEYKKLRKKIDNKLLPFLNMKIKFITSPDLKIANAWKRVSSEIKEQLCLT